MQNIKLSINSHCFFWEEYEESFFFLKRSPPRRFLHFLSH